ncbi:MAG: hypothetical protein H0W19_04285 [Nitrosopumilus sp.]|nr:hypothetical protein [Nitrosopumilus sp.]
MNNLDGDKDFDERIIHCALCGREIAHTEAWPHVDGDSNLGVKKIDYFCSEEHKAEFFGS